MSVAEVEALRALSQVLQSAGIVLGVMLAAVLTYLVGDVFRRLGPEQGALIPRQGLALRSIVPDVEMSNLRTGASFRLSDLRGSRLLIAFLSRQCRPCLELVPHLNALANNSDGARFIVILDEGDGEHHLAVLSPQISAVEDERERPISNAFEVRVEPLVYVIDREGKVVIRAVPNSLLELEDALNGSGHLQSTPWVPVQEPS